MSAYHSRLIMAWRTSFLLILIIYLNSTKGAHPGYHTASNQVSYVTAKLEAIGKWLAKRADSTVFDYIYETNRGFGLNLFEGDIKGFNPKHRSAIRNTQQLWNTRTIPYEFDPGFGADAQKDVMAAITEYHSKTCIRWVPHTNQKDYIVFKHISGCFSTIGRAGGAQDISLVKPCLRMGTAVHEMMHALGFWHEQSRPDRDGWVQIIKQNIQPGEEFNFDRLSVDQANTMGIQYDYQSVMHYSKYSFSKNGQPTILPTRDPNAQIGQRLGLSTKDVEQIKKLYHCSLPSLNPPKVTQQPPATSAPATNAPHTQAPNTQRPPLVTNPPVIVTRPPIGWTPWSTWTECDLQCHAYRTRFCLSYNSADCPGPAKETNDCPAPCQVAYSIGCWRYSSSNNTIPSVEGQYSTVTDNFRYRTAALRKCSDVASVAGYIMFALTNGGQCLTGPNAHKTFDDLGGVGSCGYQGKGGVDAMNVYTFHTKIDGGWSAWSDFGECTRSCDGGVQYSYRRCNSPPPVGSGSPCPGYDTQVRKCNENKCQSRSKCGVEFYTGTFGTTGYVNVLNYDNYMNCEYVIETADDATISLFVTRMDIEYSATCMYDALAIYDGAHSSATMVGSYCGTKPGLTFQSSSNKVKMTFQSDSTTTGGGYTIMYTFNTRTRKSCQQPIPTAHGTVLGSGNFVGDVLTYQCQSGFKLIGSRQITCVEHPGIALWTDTFPYCKSVRKRSVHHPEVCTWEIDMCGFQQDTDDDHDWIVAEYTGYNQFQPQQPSTDRNGKHDGHFLYVESSRTWRLGEVARMYSRQYTTRPGGFCVRFWYRLYGEGGLKVRLHSDDPEAKTLWRSTESAEGVWIEASVSGSVEEPFTISLEGGMGESHASSVSLDDFTVLPGHC